MAEWMDSILDTYLEVWNGADTGRLDGIASPDMIRRAGSLESHSTDGIEALKVAITRHREAFPDTKVVLKERADGADFSLFIWEFTGTNSGPGEFPATGKSASVTGATLMRYRDGKIAEEHVFLDNLGFMSQLGFQIQEPATG